jgi:4-hydroxybenzoate polyprenyltransferase
MANKLQIFVAFCALSMCLETYLLVQIPFQIPVLLTVFFSTLFIYNAAHIKIVIGDADASGKQNLTLAGEKQHIIICGIAFIIVFGSLAASHFMNIFIFLSTAILSLLYMMPFTKKGRSIKGLRNNLALKNVILSLIWASATVLFPIVGEKELPAEFTLVFMFLRRFCFIYALTVVYDIRDIEADKLAGMRTIAVQFGENGARTLAAIAILIFALLIYFDPSLDGHFDQSIEFALYASAIVTSVIIFATKSGRSKSYYEYVVDGSMALQFILVFLFSFIPL